MENITEQSVDITFEEAISRLEDILKITARQRSMRR